jgi:hemoglobin-like flavoprotein
MRAHTHGLRLRRLIDETRRQTAARYPGIPEMTDAEILTTLDDVLGDEDAADPVLTAWQLARAGVA